MTRRTPRDRCGFTWLPRDHTGRVAPVDALSRFAAKCEFDPTTGCVMWTGGKTRGRGNTAQYGAFWYEGRRHFAHRWAAVHIHGHDLSDGLQVGHTCPGGPRTLCVQHVEPQTQLDNLAEQWARLGPPALRSCRQSADERQFWLLVELGYEEPPPVASETPGAIPFHAPPDWLRPFWPQTMEKEQCPF